MSELSSTRNLEKPADWSDAPPFASPWFWLACLIVLKLVAPFVPVPNLALSLVTSIFFTFAYIIGVVMFVAQATRFSLSFVQRAALLGGTIILWSVFSRMIPLEGAPPLSPVKGTFLFAAVDLLLLLCATFGGSLVGQLKQISSPNFVGPLCGLLAMLDVWFVLYNGIASQIIKSAPTYAAKVTAAAPAVGAATSKAAQFAFHPVGIGAADYLFIGFFFAIMHRFGMNWRASTKWMIVLISGALLAVMLGIGALPGLLFIGLGAAIPNLKFFEYSKEEKLALIQAGGFVVLLTIGIYFAQPLIIARMQQVK